MAAAAVIGILVGVVGVLGGVFAALYAAGIFEYRGGKKKLGVNRISKETLREQILSVNSPDLPYDIIPSDKTDLELFWKIADARWFGIFGREKVSKTYRAYIYLDEARNTVRLWQAIDDVEWVAGAPKIHFQKEFFRGKIIYQKSSGVQYVLKEDKTFGKVYEYQYDIRAIIEPVKKLALEGGWEFVEVMLKKHAMKQAV